MTSRNPPDLTRSMGMRSTAPCLTAQRLAALNLVAWRRLVLRASRAGVALGRGGRASGRGDQAVTAT